MHDQVRIKINGKIKSYVQKEVENKDKDILIQPSDSLYQENENEDVQDLPVIIFDEVASAVEKEDSDENFDWVLPKETNDKKAKTAEKKNAYIEDLREYQRKSYPKPTGTTSLWRKKAKPGLIKQFIFSAILAIGVGLGFGGIILSIMNMSDSTIEPAVPVTKPIDNPTGTDTPGDVTSGGLSFPSFTFAVLQGGVFSSNDGADASINEYKTNGFPGVSVKDDNVFVFVGVASDVDTMKTLATIAEEKGLEPYAKEISTKEKKYESVTDKDKEFIQSAPPLLEKMIGVTGKILVGETVNPNEISSIVEQSATLATLNAEELSEPIKVLQQYFVATAQDMNSYTTSNDRNDIVSAQQNLLSIIKQLY
ncbi:hypothetical protein [Bacillus sp. FJAT-45066]|uniref:hypothetical protein n=1 Tax=Bacillus sp. FJAT-45066 TaxID=2011010 RepID=UPI000BB9BB8A|nr:hypothetical protein [Bacillus sp. FJAT-45066]